MAVRRWVERGTLQAKSKNHGATLKRVLYSLVLTSALILNGCVSLDEPIAVNAGQASNNVDAENESTPRENTEASPTEEAKQPAPDWTQSASPADVEKCKVLDGQSPAARAAREGGMVEGKRARGNIGFPLSPTSLPVSGDSNFIAVMVSFDDAPPSGQTPEDYLKPQLDKIEQWGDFWSQGKLDFNFQLVEDWINIPVNHQDYPVNRRLPFEERQGNANKIIKLIAAALPPELDYENLDGLVIYWSPGVDYFEGDLGLQGFEGVSLPFPGANKQVYVWSGNEWWYRDTGAMTAEIKSQYTWSFWIYLMLDSMGLHNHGPGNGWPSGLQQMQVAANGEHSGSIIGWDEFKLGWTDDSQVHCLDPAALSGSNEFLLTPREIRGGDRRLAVVPFEDQGALVIESRRPVGWSETWTSEKSGLIAYFVDTELDLERVDSFTQGGCGNNPDQPKWAYYLYKDGFSGDCRQFSNVFVHEGETLTFQSVQIELVHSSDSLDYVRVTNLNG